MDNSDYIEELKVRDKGLKPIKMELGGDFYYKCHWLTCDSSLKRYMNYCYNCGQKILWDDELG